MEGMTGFFDLRPHRIALLTQTEGYEDSNGDWHEGKTLQGEWMACHAVPGGPASCATFPDGTIFSYSYAISGLAPDCPEFGIGQKIRLDLHGTERDYEVKGFFRYMLQGKLWV